MGDYAKQMARELAGETDRARINQLLREQDDAMERARSVKQLLGSEDKAKDFKP